MVKARQWMVAMSLLGGVGLAVAQDIHKWTDANGKVHFGDDASAPGSSSAVEATGGNFVKTEKPKYAGRQPIATSSQDYAGPRVVTNLAPPPAKPPVFKSDPNVTIRTVAPSSMLTPAAPGQVLPNASANAAPYPSSQTSQPATDYSKPPSCAPIERDMVSPKSGMTIRVKEYPCREGSIPVQVGKEESFWEKQESERQQRSLDRRTGRERQYLDAKGTLREDRRGSISP